MLRKKSWLSALLLPMIFAASTSMAQMSQNVVRIGVLGDMSGPFADNAGPGSVTAAKMAAEEFGGNVNGVPIEVISGNHQNKPDVGSALAKEWYDSKNVDVIVDVPISSVALAVQGVAKAGNKIVLFSSAGATAISGKNCSANSFQWTFDTYALAAGATDALMKMGLDTWFFFAPDYAFGADLQSAAARIIASNHGKVVGSIKYPLDNRDFSSFLLTAQQSKAKVIAINGGDWVPAVKQAKEFGVIDGGQKIVGLWVQLNDVKALGLRDGQGLLVSEAFYWDLNAETRAWSQRFFARMKRMPTAAQAGTYSAVLHYLRAIKAMGTDATEPVSRWMHTHPVNDMMTNNAQIRADGRVVRDFYLFRVKSPSESKGDWDLYQLVKKIPAEVAVQPISESACLLDHK